MVNLIQFSIAAIFIEKFVRTNHLSSSEVVAARYYEHLLICLN